MKFMWLQYQKMLKKIELLNIEKLNDIVYKYNNSLHRTIKMKTIDIRSGTYVDFCKMVHTKLVKRSFFY